jgi:hypothetical protein
MKKATLFTFLVLIMGGLAFMQSCDPDKNDPPGGGGGGESEFIADNATFANWMTWTLRDTNAGPDPALGTAHQGNDSTVTRYIYVRGDSMRIDSQFPVGTVIVKYTSNDSTINEYLAMVKRGNNYNPSFGNWEFFVLTSTGEIMKDGNGDDLRGKGLMGGACEACHSTAGDKDFIFTE